MGGRKLGIVLSNTRESKVCYLSAKWIVDPAQEEEEKRSKDAKDKAQKDAQAALRKKQGLPDLTPEEEKAEKDKEYARKHAESQHEKHLNRLIVLTPNDHSAQSPRTDGFDTPQLLYTTTQPVWHHCACSSLNTFITLPSTLGLFMKTVDAPYEGPTPAALAAAAGATSAAAAAAVAVVEEEAEDAINLPRVFHSNTHEMIPVVEQPASVHSFPGLWPVQNVLPASGRFVFDRSHILLASSWRSQDVLLLCNDEDDSLSRLPLPMDAGLGASMRILDVDRATGRLIVGVSDLSSTESLYIGDLRVLAPNDTVAVGADFLPVCVVHRDGAAYHDDENQGEDAEDQDDEDEAYAQIKYTKLLAGAPPMHPEAARRLAGAKMEVIQVPLSPDQTYASNGAPQLPFEAILLTPGATFDAATADPLQPCPPLLVFPHGGPHGANNTAFAQQIAFYTVVGFSVLLINYRGSTGFGQEALATLPGKCGTQDVSDCLAAVELVCSRTGKQRVCDRANIHVQGGSHGGFLTTHLIGQAPLLFQTAVARNPVCNIASMISTSDIPGQRSTALLHAHCTLHARGKQVRRAVELILCCELLLSVVLLFLSSVQTGATSRRWARTTILAQCRARRTT